MLCQNITAFTAMPIVLIIMRAAFRNLTLAIGVKSLNLMPRYSLLVTYERQSVRFNVTLKAGCRICV